ncbi:hypothetical protein, partial [Hymenobacter agri]
MTLLLTPKNNNGPCNVCCLALITGAQIENYCWPVRQPRCRVGICCPAPPSFFLLMNTITLRPLWGALLAAALLLARPAAAQTP